MSEDVKSTSKAAAYIGVPAGTLRNWRARGDKDPGPVHWVDERGEYKYPKEYLDQWVEERIVKAEKKNREVHPLVVKKVTTEYVPKEYTAAGEERYARRCAKEGVNSLTRMLRYYGKQRNRHPMFKFEPIPGSPGRRQRIRHDRPTDNEQKAWEEFERVPGELEDKEKAMWIKMRELDDEDRRVTDAEKQARETRERAERENVNG